ncbi:hypothetical protein [Aureispira anguillae]|uniref:Uncharacterized protein n=1 Tax=Aureispira anguillae TaxID=2864201 RepID=A0A916DST4_9BACT|nr:hypothetical protein [Aureispira anguillae]BDS11021.1 hypothetical protein AsAng_0017310 [Aureispira anguillae]
MSQKNEGWHFAKIFLLFIGLELVLYTLIVYLDLLGLKSDFAKRDPSFMAFYGISSILFFVFIKKLDKK